MPPLLEAALAYHALGLAIIPVRGKDPACRRWKPFQTQPADLATVRRWFGPKGPRGVTGMAVVLGEGSGDLFCRDFDTPERYESWKARHPCLAATLPTARSHRGYHVYAVCPGQRVQGAVDGERRGAGGYVVLPPSAHQAGGHYRWIIPFGPALPPKVDASVFADEERATESTEKTECTECTERKTEKTEEMSVFGSSSSSSLPPIRTNQPDQIPASASLPPPPPPPTTTTTTTTTATAPPSFPPEIEAAIVATQPNNIGKRHRCVFALARHLKARPELASSPFASLKPIVREWHRRAKKVIGTKEFDETWIDFTRGWDRVKWAVGTTAMDEIIAAALKTPPPSCAAVFENPQVRALVSICRALQRHAGDGEFFLSCRVAGRHLGVEFTTASRWLWLLQVEGIIKIGVKGGRDKGTVRTASRYRYIPTD